jgi:hypothetical protein
MSPNHSLTLESASQNESDLEKSAAQVTQSRSNEDQTQPSNFKRLTSYGVEVRGIMPVALEDRTDTRPINIFSFWWIASLGLLP